MDTSRFAKIPFDIKIGHICAEVTRARVWSEKGHEDYCRNALGRALELVSLSIGHAPTPGWEKELRGLQDILARLCEQGPVDGAVLLEIEEHLTRIVVASAKGS